MIGYLCKSLRIINLVLPTRLIFLAIGEVLSFGFNLAVSFPSDSRGNKARIVLLPSRIKRWGLLLGNVAENKDTNKSRLEANMIRDRPGGIGFTSGFSQHSK